MTKAEKVHPYMFRVCFIDPYQGTALADFAYNELGLRKVAMMAGVGDPYAEQLSQYFKEQFTGYGGEIVAEMGYQIKDVEFRAQLSQAAEVKAEALFVPATVYRDVGLMAKTSKRFGFEVHIYVRRRGLFKRNCLISQVRNWKVHICPMVLPRMIRHLKRIKKGFAEKHPGQSANIYVAYTLDAMKLLESAIIRANSF